MEVIFTKKAIKDFEKIKKNPSLYSKVSALLDLLEKNPFETPPSYEKLMGFNNVYSRRVNIEHRLVYEVFLKEDKVKIIRMTTHYE